jgi:hypothetical protein
VGGAVDREEIGSSIGLGLGLAMLGIGFTMRGDLNWATGTGFVVLGTLMVIVAALKLYRHERRKRRSAVEPLLPMQMDAVALPPESGPSVHASPALEAPHTALSDEDGADIIRHLPADQRQLLQQCAETGVGYDFPPYFTAPPLVKNDFIKAIFEEATRFPNYTMYKLSPWVEASVKAYFSSVSPPPVEPGFTSDGLDWKPLLGGGVLRIVPTESGSDLPQPLTLRVQCSTEPRDGWATFYSDTKVGDSNRGYDPVRAEIKGNFAFFVLKAPKLRAPAMLSVSLIGISANEVVDVQRQRAT